MRQKILFFLFFLPSFLAGEIQRENLALTYLETGRLEEAKAIYDQLLEKPDLTIQEKNIYLFNLGTLFLKENEPLTSLEIFDQIETKDSLFSPLLYRLWMNKSIAAYQEAGLLEEEKGPLSYLKALYFFDLAKDHLQEAKKAFCLFSEDLGKKKCLIPNKFAIFEQEIQKQKLLLENQEQKKQLSSFTDEKFLLTLFFFLSEENWLNESIDYPEKYASFLKEKMETLKPLFSKEDQAKTSYFLGLDALENKELDSAKKLFLEVKDTLSVQVKEIKKTEPFQFLKEKIQFLFQDKPLTLEKIENLQEIAQELLKDEKTKNPFIKSLEYAQSFLKENKNQKAKLSLLVAEYLAIQNISEKLKLSQDPQKSLKAYLDEAKLLFAMEAISKNHHEEKWIQNLQKRLLEESLFFTTVSYLIQKKQYEENKECFEEFWSTIFSFFIQGYDALEQSEDEKNKLKALQDLEKTVQKWHLALLAFDEKQRQKKDLFDSQKQNETLSLLQKMQAEDQSQPFLEKEKEIPSERPW